MLGVLLGGKMKECKGLFGKIFGHKYQSFLSSYNGPTPSSFSKTNIDEKYIIICVRCGDKK